MKKNIQDMQQKDNKIKSCIKNFDFKDYVLDMKNESDQISKMKKIIGKYLETNNMLGNSNYLFDKVSKDHLLLSIKKAKEEKLKFQNIIFNLELFLVDVTNYIKRKQIEREDLRQYDDEPKLLTMPEYIHIEMKKSGLREKLIEEKLTATIDPAYYNETKNKGNNSTFHLKHGTDQQDSRIRSGYSPKNERPASGIVKNERIDSGFVKRINSANPQNNPFRANPLQDDLNMQQDLFSRTLMQQSTTHSIFQDKIHNYGIGIVPKKDYNPDKSSLALFKSAKKYPEKMTDSILDKTYLDDPSTLQHNAKNYTYQSYIDKNLKTKPLNAKVSKSGHVKNMRPDNRNYIFKERQSSQDALRSFNSNKMMGGLQETKQIAINARPGSRAPSNLFIIQG